MEPQQLPPPWMLGSKEIDDIPMLVVFMSKGELEGLDALQGGPSEDDETGIREYSPLAPIIEIPEIRELFHKIPQELIANKNKLPEDTQEAYNIAKEYSLPYRETEEEKENPLKALEKKGRNGDSRIAYIPANLVELLIEVGYRPTVHPEVGILEFWALNKLWKNKVVSEGLRIVGTIGGAILGGPVGAGVGNAVAGAVTGKSLKNSVISGLKTGAGAYAAQGLGQAAGLGAKTPFTAGFFGGAPNMLATGLGKFGIGSANAPAAAGAIGVGAPAETAQQVIGSAFSQPQTPGILGGLSSGLSAMAPYAAPLSYAGMGLLSYAGQKKQHKHEKEERERQEEKWDRERKQMGWDTDWQPMSHKPHEVNPEFWNIDEEDIKHGRIHAPYTREVGTSNHYAKGGLVQSYSQGSIIKGPGKGQDDKIETTVPEASYIWDASSTSMSGDGSSSAGAKAIKHFEDDIKRAVPKKIRAYAEKLVKKNCKQAPVYLSNDEYKSDPVVVSLIPYALGHKQISNEKGADILREGIKRLRKHKSSSGSGLPPKAKPIIEYMLAR
jgi:hypothetical protein